MVASIAFVVVLLINVLGYGAIWGFNAYTVQKAARADLNWRLTRLQALAAGGQSLTSGKLGAARVDLVGVDSDLRQLRALLPLGSVSPIEPEASIAHALNLGIDVVDAALAGDQVAQTLAPALQALISSATHGTSSQAPPAGAHALTPHDITVAQHALAIVAADWSAALAERPGISPAALQSLGDPRLGKLLVRFDSAVPTVTQGISLASAALDWSPKALGLLGPDHTLLFDMDTDELRPTGGFLGAYADLTFSQGALTSGVHLHDIYTLDCPNTICRPRQIPALYSWFPLSDTTFGLRDSNLNPDFATFAGLASQLYQQDTGSRIDAVVAITPAIIADALQVTGPITVPQFNAQVTAVNMNATIHYYHQHPEITARLGVNYKALGSSLNKAFDALLSRALLARLSALSASQQAQLGMLLVKAFATKDIQLFVNDTRLETQLRQVGVAGQVLAPSYDNLMVVDANDGASYANADMQETISDNVALDAVGGATHRLTVSYYYHNASHVYTQKSIYEDFVRLLLPVTVGSVSVSGPCTPHPSIQAYHFSFGCQVAVTRGARVTVTFTWRTPHAFTVGHQATYRLLIQRQAGAHVGMQVGISAPTGQALFAQDSALRATQGQLVWSANPLLTNTMLTARVG